jgi:V/A-type H+-transporting ATPase subunit K
LNISEKGNRMEDARKRLKANIIQSIIIIFVLIGISGTFFCSHAFGEVAQDDQIAAPAVQDAGVMKYGLIAAAIAFGLGALGAGFAISHVGAAAMGAIAEKPQIAGQALIFVALAEGLVVFGFITALMILGKV